MLTHNAPHFVRTAVQSIRQNTGGILYELIVVDNASQAETVDLLIGMKESKAIDRLVLSPVNTLFAEGNNIAARHARSDATHFLLVNSDIEIKSPQWLEKLLEVHESPGITSYGIVEHDPLRVDGYCFLIDADLYRRHGGLDEGFQWWWSITKLQAKVLVEGGSVKGYRRHDKMLLHFGGKSGDGFSNAKGMNVSRQEVVSWFQGRQPSIIDDSFLSRSRRQLGRLYRSVQSRVR